MQARALVAGRHVGKAVGGFEGEGFEDVHRRIVALATIGARSVGGRNQVSEAKRI